MRKKKNSPFGDFIGRIGNMVCYPLNGQIVCRTIGKVTHWSEAQQAVQMRTELISPILIATKKYIDAGFKTTPRLQTWSINNKATSENNPSAIKGSFPDLEVDYSKLLFSMGNLPVPKNPQVQLVNNVLTFSWEADLENENANDTDQIMLLDYFPEKLKTLMVLSGNQRPLEQHKITLPTWTEETLIETYLSFVSEDRNSISNSIYAGQIIWNKNSAGYGNI